ncbi:MAG TPA: tetratricopeptide repeat protein, partial [Opitutaceae bacterium]|nr:tetratricopeptide repeat protein [Opitutaceae bacterium]
MLNPAASDQFFLSKRQRTLLLAALLALGPVWPVLSAQPADVATVRSRADAGDPEAQNALANLYVNGQGVPQNDAEAIRLYTLAAAAGHPAASFNLGMLTEMGRGTAQDSRAAFRHYLKAAEAGFAPAQFNVGNMYANGVGVPQDYFEAALWFRQAAEAGVPEAQYNLGLAYEIGRGLAKDEMLAQRWYRAAAEQNYARARYNLALMLEEGRGSAMDEAMAAQLYRTAALQGFGPAQNNYGIMLAEGRGGLASNFKEAYAWLALAAENGVTAVGRDLVAARLQPAELAEARARQEAIKAQMEGRTIAPAAIPAPGSEVATRQLAELGDQLRNAQGEMDRLRTENTRLAGTVQAIQSEKIQLERKLAQLAAETRPAAPD